MQDLFDAFSAIVIDPMAAVWGRWEDWTDNSSLPLHIVVDDLLLCNFP
ncbi:hypothetical protein QWY85_01715 [Neolewinella lacunae]|uniref:Uncharacterized protein n=1 Tax=Neolewinella lacunae TaxID=1517758 RepID=A0A923T8C4_9BACT|nr:hypothetical protein [Neolewinella lacunae]MBC6994419.1 hypothetical protein [Neolewinella lacunae]MDN3633355.1 hypothetical protein [Neolewinella lacunae]